MQWDYDNAVIDLVDVDYGFGQILGMIEEAAGTRMYEMKKQAAQKTIEKKDLKLMELNSVGRV